MPFRYQSPFDYLVSDFKFRHNLAGGDLLAQLFCQQRQLPTPLPDRLIPVPLHRRRLRQRGFNQAQLLATAIGRQIGIAVDHQLVQRIRHTPAQHELSGKQRRRNLRGAFELTADCKGLSLAIVDDVVTTGSTVNELARVLKQAGANSVQAWAIARTPAK
ncbi:MAG: phosphoribosyltransferase family protein [Chromatiales bacterium]|jgi:ComF family protein